MSISMSLNQGCVNSLTAIATATQGLLLGSIQIGVLYFFTWRVHCLWQVRQ